MCTMHCNHSYFFSTCCYSLGFSLLRIASRSLNSIIFDMAVISENALANTEKEKKRASSSISQVNKRSKKYK